MAEAHPVGFQWVMEAKARGATVIHVDPRFSRTSALADMHVPIRAGSDIAFLGGIINYVLRASATSTTTCSPTPTRRRSSARISRTPKTWTACSAAWTASSGLRLRDLAVRGGRVGAAAGYRDRREQRGRQRPAPAGPRGGPRRSARLRRRGRASGARHRRDAAASRAACSRSSSGTSPATPRRWSSRSAASRRSSSEPCASRLTSNSGRDRTTAFVYGVGWTQHTVGAQYIRTAAILQLLLGNMGRPGGGIMALRGHASHPGLDRHPDPVQPAARLPPDAARARQRGPRRLHRGRVHADNGFWANMRSYMVSLLKAWWGAGRDAGERLLLRLPAPAHRQPRHLRDRAGAARRGRARATSCSARTRPSARPTAACSGWAWPSWTGWWCATSR